MAESQVGDTIAVLWSSDKVSRGEMWKGVKIGDEKTTMLVDYGKFGELTFPPTNARVHGVEKIATDPYSAAMERVEGRETGTFEPLELSTYATFIEGAPEKDITLVCLSVQITTPNHQSEKDSVARKFSRRRVTTISPCAKRHIRGIVKPTKMRERTTPSRGEDKIDKIRYPVWPTRAMRS